MTVFIPKFWILFLKLHEIKEKQITTEEELIKLGLRRKKAKSSPSIHFIR